jgi:hypothetical protein
MSRAARTLIRSVDEPAANPASDDQAEADHWLERVRVAEAERLLLVSQDDLHRPDFVSDPMLGSIYVEASAQNRIKFARPVTNAPDDGTAAVN